MGTITAQSIINKASIELNDTANVRWSRSELLGWLNDGQRQIVMMSPNATNKIATVQLVAGSRQSIPEDGWTLLELIRYMGTDGNKPGRAIRLASRRMLDAYNPDWHNDNKTTTPKHYLFDQQDQTVFYVYPPNNGNGYVQLNYSPVPADLTSETDTISLNDIFQTVLLDYVLYRACSKDAEYAPTLAGNYLQTFMGAIQAKRATETDNSPNQQMGGFDPNIAGAEA